MVSATARTVEISNRCTACGLCLITCGERALRRAPKRPAVVDDLCTGCGACIEVCPVDAIRDVWLSHVGTSEVPMGDQNTGDPNTGDPNTGDLKTRVPDMGDLFMSGAGTSDV